MVQGLPEPEPGYKWVLQMPDATPRRRSPWPWIVSILVIAVLMAGAWFAGEWLARDLVERSIRGQVIDSLGLPSDQDIDVEVVGPVLPQLISGTLDDVRVASDEVTFGSFQGDVSVRAAGVPVRGEEPMDAADATVSMDEAQLRTLLATIDGFPADSMGLTAPNVTMSTEIVLFGSAFPVGVLLAPGADEGRFTLTPTGFDVAGTQISADALRQQFGVLADVVLRTWGVCIADALPSGLTLTSVQTEPAGLVATFDIAPSILHDSALQEPGTCA